MAHNLEQKDGKTSFVAVGEKAWHGLGTIIPEPMTAEQVVKLSGMDFEVGKTPIIINPKEELVTLPDVYATYRLDNSVPLGLVSDRYEIVQNIDAFTFFDPIIDRGEAIYQTAGVLGKGERVFITAKLPKDITVGGEKVEMYLLITNGHDGKNAVKIGFTPIRVVCNNTLTAALNNLKNSVTIFHYNNPKSQLEQAHEVMGLASEYSSGISQVFEELANVQINDEQLMAYIQKLFVNENYVEKNEKVSTRSINICKKVFDFAKCHSTQQTSETKGTLYGAYNSISGYYTYLKEYKSAEERMNYISFGLGNNKIREAFALCTDAKTDIEVLNKPLHIF